MAEGDITVYNNFKERLMELEHNMASGGNTYRVTLHTGYTPNIDTHTTWADVSATEYSTGANYTADGKALANQDATQDDTDNEGVFDADDLVWTALGALSPATPGHAILRKAEGGAASNDELVAYMELGTTATNGGDYTIAWAAEGILNLT